ncbi:MAG: phosphoribosylglycinamide formyltransferase [Vicinamibacterales bacterium]
MLNTHRPLRVAVLCSHRAPGLLYLLNRAPDRGAAFEIVCCVTSEQTFTEEVRVERRGIPSLVHPIRAFHEARGVPLHRNPAARAEYDAATLTLLAPYFADVLLLDGYLYLVTATMLHAFPSRILNLHYSDLTLRHPDGRPQFPGIRAVRDALAAGCTETRATVHLVNDETDGGAPIVRSWPFPVSPLVADLQSLGAPDVFKAYAYAHQQWMMRTVSGPLTAAALRLVATGAVDLDELALARSGAPNTPWLLDPHNFLLAPEVELAEQH